MIDVLDIPDFRKRVAPISVELFHRMINEGVFGEKSYELIEGVLVEKMSKSDLHVLIVRILFHRLSQVCPERHFIQKEDPITLDTSEPEPDLAVIEGDWQTVGKPTSALFVIEVAITSLTEDRAKAPGFARAGVQEYWIVCPNFGKIEVFRNPENGLYQSETIIDDQTIVTSEAVPGFQLDLSEILDSLKE